jgi:hypothetical protein
MCLCKVGTDPGGSKVGLSLLRREAAAEDEGTMTEETLVGGGDRRCRVLSVWCVKYI